MDIPFVGYCKSRTCPRRFYELSIKAVVIIYDRRVMFLSNLTYLCGLYTREGLPMFNAKQIAGHIIGFVSQNLKDNKSIQGEIDLMCGEGAVSMLRDLGKGEEISTCLHKETDSHIKDVLAAIVDAAPAKATRDNAISDFIKRVNRTFSNQAKILADVEVQTGKKGTMHYPCVGRSVRDGNVETKWSTKELAYEPVTGKDGKIKEHAKTSVVTESKSNNKGSKDEPRTMAEPTNLPELVASVLVYCEKLGIDPKDVAKALAPSKARKSRTTAKPRAEFRTVVSPESLAVHSDKRI